MHFARQEVARRFLAPALESRPQDAPYRIIQRNRACYITDCDVTDCDGCDESDTGDADGAGALTGHHDSQAGADEAAASSADPHMGQAAAVPGVRGRRRSRPGTACHRRSRSLSGACVLPAF
ncbi:hypothetical protein HS041_28335 [Planomonospora sp. ID67723]|uniref:hypothetical protein n=1 Tax=Planomonospora sp. ID67723 TaxID=2738134 RepID=UPI0018C423A1|nr:hypothetical protein [Planomonospora sp. ID67723]MBG0831643.1 hypothetical protein [Planomonospora sp. ID67723]